MSNDARWIVFASEASDLVAGDTNGEPDVFLHDTDTGETVSLTIGGNGRSGVCAANSDGSWTANVDITPDGAYVFFTSRADNLATNGTPVDSGTTTVYRWSRADGSITPISYYDDPDSNFFDDDGCWPSTSDDGAQVVFTSDNTEQYDPTFTELNIDADVFVWTSTGLNAQSHLNSGTDDAPAVGHVTERNPIHISGNGEWLVYHHTDREGIQDAAWLYDRRLFTAVPIGGADAHGTQPAVDADARHVAFVSDADLDASGEDDDGDLDVFVQDRVTEAITRISQLADGTLPSGFFASERPNLSADGDVITFQSRAELVTGVGTAAVGIYAWHVDTEEMVLLSPDPTGGVAFGSHPDVSANGQWVSFRSPNANLVADDDNAAGDVFLVPSDGALVDPDPDPEEPYEDPGTVDGLADMTIAVVPPVALEGGGWEIGLDLSNPDSSDAAEELALEITGDIFDAAPGSLSVADPGDFNCSVGATSTTCELEEVPFDWNQTIIVHVEPPDTLEQDRQLGFTLLTLNDPYRLNNVDSATLPRNADELIERRCGCGGDGAAGLFLLPMVLLVGRRRRA